MIQRGAETTEMTAAEKTKLRIAEGMKNLLDNYSVEKITVKQIVEASGVTRPTFYRYFKDKYDLINWYFDILASKSIPQMGVSMTLREALTMKYVNMRRAGNFFPAAFRSRQQNCLVEYDYECIYQFFRDFLQKKTGRDVPEEQDFALQLYCSGAIVMTMKWAVGDMSKEPEVMADDLIDALPEKLRVLFPLG